MWRSGPCGVSECGGGSDPRYLERANSHAPLRLGLVGPAQPAEPEAPAPVAAVPREPVVTSSNDDVATEERPRKVGWWQRKSFF